MTSIRIALAAFLVVCSVSAVATATALGAKGELVNKKGEALVKNKFTVHDGTTAIETTGGSKMTCTEASGTGVVKSKTEGEDTVTYKGCSASGVKCNGEGSEAGEIKLTRWWRDFASLPSILLGNSILTTLHFTCGGLVKGTLLGDYAVPIEPVEKFKTEFTFNAKETKGVQEPFEEFDTLKASIGGGKEEQAGVSGAETFHFEEEAEYV
jgi:hypothetical protein